MMQKPVIFLDRDGVLIHEVHYLNTLDKIQLYEDVPKGLKRLKRAGYLLIMVTNQSGVARGFFTESFVKEAFKEINQKLSKSQVELDAIYYCPHHLKGKAPYNIECNCRKPSPGMIQQAMENFEIDLNKSYMIGDKLCDVELGINCGVMPIQLLTGHGQEERSKVESKYPETPILQAFSNAVDLILNNDRP